MAEQVIVNFMQGPDYAKEAAQSAQAAAQSATNASLSADNAKNSADKAADSASSAADSASSAADSASSAADSATAAAGQATLAQGSSQNAEMYAQTAFSASAPAWDGTATYNYPTVVAYTDGFTYRCIGQNVTGADIPGQSDKWQILSLNADDFFEEDSQGRYMPTLSPTFATRWVLDGNGNIEPSA